MISYIFSLAVYLGPVFLLFYLSLDIRNRNRINDVNKIVSSMLMAAMFLNLGDFLISFFPEEHAEGLILLFYYIPAFVVMVYTNQLSFRITDKLRHVPGWLSGVICCWPFIPGIYILLPSPYINIDLVPQGSWTYQVPSVALHLVTLLSGLLTLTILLACSWIQYRDELRKSNFIKMKQMRVLLAGILLSTVWILITTLLFTRASIVSEYIHAPIMGMYAPVIFAMFIRYSMVRYDFFPSIEKKYQILYDRSPLSILLLDQHGVLQDVNPEAAHLFETEAPLSWAHRFRSSSSRIP